MFWIGQCKMGLFTCAFRVFGVLALLKIQGFVALEITRLTVPRWVENGTEISVILDCEYEYTNKDERLVVKWYYNDDPQPFYQWIPELNTRHVSPKFHGRIDMDYKVTPASQYTRFRALNILKPTTDLSGKYVCHISSLAGQDSAEMMMTVYSPAKTITFNHSREEDNMLNLTCEVDGIFPLPHIDLYQMGPGEIDPNIIDDIDIVSYYDDDEDVYRVLAMSEISEKELADDGLTFFDCVIDIPGTDYRTTKRIAYIPGVQAAAIEDPDDDATRSVPSTVAFLIIILTLLLQTLW